MDDLEHVEKDLEQDLKLNDYKEEIQKRAKKLYVYLVSFVRGDQFGSSGVLRTLMVFEPGKGFLKAKRFGIV